MSNLVNVQCTTTAAKRIDARIEELQRRDPAHYYIGSEALDDLIHYGWLATRLPETELQALAKRASEILAG